MSKKKQLSYHAFLKRVADTIEQYDMLHKGDKVLVAVSGGADSVCLLKALLDMRDKLGISVAAANMDHGLRGKESAKDSRFVKTLAEKLGVKLFHKKVAAASGPGKGKSVEERAREKRYDFLVKAAASHGCNVIATGHTMDDQAETVLMKVIYGASISGITGIPPVRQEKTLRIVRPLIRVERKDVLVFLEKAGMGHVEDSSNLDLKFQRNRIRHEVIPRLEKYNPKLKRTLTNLADTLREDLLFLDGLKKRSAAGRGARKSAGVGVSIRDLILQPKTLRKEIFKELFTRAGGNVKKLTYRHWIDADRFLRTAEKGRSLDLPGGVKVMKKNSELVFRRYT